MKKVFAESYPSAEMSSVFGPDSEFESGRKSAKEFVSRSGFKEFPQVLMNGIPFDKKNLEGEREKCRRQIVVYEKRFVFSQAMSSKSP